MIITIDGPAASGKSSAARCLAKKLDYYYVYSGLLYRACAYVLTTHSDYSKENLAYIRTEDVLALCNPERLSYAYTHHTGEQVTFDNSDITPYLKSALMDDCASLISTNIAIRHAVNTLQRSLGTAHNIIADGRDMGTAIFPHAEIKFFLTASVEVRATRWQHDQHRRGNVVSIKRAVSIITERDHRDTIRDHSPLSVAPDAIMIDNTNLSADETCALMEKYVEKYVSISL